MWRFLVFVWTAGSMLVYTARAEFQPMRVPKGTYHLDPAIAAMDAEGRLVTHLPAHCLDNVSNPLGNWTSSAASDADLKMLGECGIGLPNMSEVFTAARNLELVVRVGQTKTVRPLAEAVADGSVEIVGDGSRSLLVRFKRPERGTSIDVIAGDTAVVARDANVARATLDAINASPAASTFYVRADRMTAGLSRLPADAHRCTDTTPASTA